MPVETIAINDVHISEAESIFLEEGMKFDLTERVPFIKSLSSCDLLAVPGSGKTTALMAKLYCLSKLLPFNDGRGILLLAHTNSAVNEIEGKLKKICPILFEYPNFVGTIQSFVNKFLANPANILKYGSRIARNENEIYRIEAMKFYNSLPWYKKEDEKKNVKNLLYFRANHGRNNLSSTEKATNTIDFLCRLKFDLTSRKFLHGEKETTLLKFDGNNTNAGYYELENWKESLFREGTLSYRDSYTLGNWYLNSYPDIYKQLQHRFGFVFIDEMQDLEAFQIELIDKIFYTKNTATVIQRIGDINQAIYSSGMKVKTECDWKPRNEMYLNGSKRLTKENGDLINCFTLDDKGGKFFIDGQRQLGNGNIPPHLIVFNNQSKTLLKDLFRDIITKFQAIGKMPAVPKDPIKIIGWVGEKDIEDCEKLTLENTFGYKKEALNNREEFDSLSKYIQLFDHNKNGLSNARKSVLNALIYILRLQGIKYKTKYLNREVERYYSKAEFVNAIKNYKSYDQFHLAYEDFKHKLYDWSFDLTANGHYEKVYRSIIQFIYGSLMEWFEIKDYAAGVRAFIGNYKIFQTSSTIPEKVEAIQIDVATIHAVKGQTHSATMFMETFYHDYEIKKLKNKNPFFKEKHGSVVGKKKKDGSELDVRAKETIKMIYVGFSRPTHLLCYAVMETNLEIGDIEKFRNSGWAIDQSLATSLKH